MSTKVRLTRKFAHRLNGVDLSRARAGEEIDVLPHEADMLIAEGWAEPAGQPSKVDSKDEAPRRHRGKRSQL